MARPKIHELTLRALEAALNVFFGTTGTIQLPSAI